MLRVDDLRPGTADSVFHLRPGNPKPTLLTGLPFHFVPRRMPEFGEAPRLGEHTESALKVWLGLATSEIVALRESGVLS
jgi:hypothetical protein